MTIQKLNELSASLNKMSKSELVELGRKYNKFVKLPNLQKMKKQELLLELLSNYKIVHQIWSGKTKIELPTRKGAAPKKLDNSKINDLIKQKLELNKKAMKADGSEKSSLLKKVAELDKIILKSL